MIAVTRRAWVVALLVSILFWALDAFVEAHYLRLDSFENRALWRVSQHELNMRLVVVAVIFAAAATLSLARGRERRTSTAHREAQRTLATLMSNLPGLCYRCRDDQDRTLEFVSDGCVELTGCQPGDFLDGARTTYAQLIHPEDRERVARSVQEAVAARRPFELNYRIRRADGEERHVWERGRAVVGPQGDVLAIEGFITDVTKQRRAEMALRDYSERLRNLRDIDTGILAARSPRAIAHAAVERIAKLVPCCGASVALFDLESRDLEILAVWAGGETRFQSGSRFPIDASFGDLDRLRSGLPNSIADVAAFPSPKPLLARLCADDLRSISVVPLVASGQLLGSLNLASRVPAAFTAEMLDIAKEVASSLAVAILNWRLHEQLQRKAEELEHRVRERTADLQTFTHSVAHDLRAPLRAIDGLARTLDETSRDRLDEEGRRLLRLVRGKALVLRQLLEDLLTFYRLSHEPVAASDVDLGALAQAEFARIQAAEPTRLLRLEVAPLPRARGDVAMLRLALGNLIANAVKFTRVRAEGVVSVGVEKGADGAPVFTVRDNGVGFAPAAASRLFEAFERLHPADEYEGTGMGLAIVRRVVERHGGRVWADATPEAGATFRFTLAGTGADPRRPRAAEGEA